MALRNRYVGVQPYQTQDRDLFFGRDDDIENLYDFLMLEKLVVLFAKSGYGKSSLLNAGVVPRLIDESQPASFRFTPIELRFGTYVPGQSFSPLETTRRTIANIAPSAYWDFLGEARPDDSLWLLLKRRQSEAHPQFVLVFDQFEEFFSYPIAQREAFSRELAELLYATLPAALRDRLDSFDPAQTRDALQSINAKVVVSIRSDRMSLLDGLRDELPAILHKRFELKQLTLAQAREAITQPAQQGHEEEAWRDRFHTPPFEYTEAALNKIEEELSDEGEGGIEAFQLQIVCAEIERAVAEGKVPDRDGNGLPDVDTADLPDFSRLYENYYRSRLEALPPDKQQAAQRMLEEGLLTTDPTTGEGRRMSVDGNALLAQFGSEGLTPELLQLLERNYLIRREANTVGGFSYEISHDTLLAPVQRARSERRAAEERAAANRRVRRLAGTVVLSLVLLGGAVGFTVWAFAQKRAAESAQRDAEVARADALENAKIARLGEKRADSLAREVVLKLQIANEAILATNIEKLRAAQNTLEAVTVKLKRYELNFSDVPPAVREARNAVQQARRNRDLYQRRVDSLQSTLSR